MAHEDLDEEKWEQDQRLLIEAYLHKQGVAHGGVGERPAFSIPPYLALWAIQSHRVSGRVGWWAISGDVPTDCLSSDDGKNPREALRAFSKIWREVSDCMAEGKKHPTVNIGPPDRWKDFAPLLRRRADLLEEFAANDELWEE